MLALIAVYLALFFDYTPNLAAGEVGTIAIIAADRKQARAIFRYAKGLLEGSPALAEQIEDSPNESIVTLPVATVNLSSTAPSPVTQFSSVISRNLPTSFLQIRRT